MGGKNDRKVMWYLFFLDAYTRTINSSEVPEAKRRTNWAAARKRRGVYCHQQRGHVLVAAHRGLRRMLLHPQEGEDEGVTCPDRRGGDAGLCWWCEP